jgi:hypothetical protein
MAEAVVEIPKPIAAKAMPKRSAKRINILGNIVYLKILRASRFKKPYTFMGRLDWDRQLDHLAGLRPAQRKVVSSFISAAHNTSGLSLADRMAIISAVLKGRKFGGKERKAPYPRLSPSELKAKIDAVKAAIGVA